MAPSARRKDRFIWPALQWLLCGDDITYSSSTFASQFPDSKLLPLALALDRAEAALFNRGKVIRRRFDEAIRSILQQNSMADMQKNIACNLAHFDTMSYLVLGYRLLNILRNSSSFIPPPPRIRYPKINKHKPITRMFTAKLFDWPSLMKEAHSDIKNISVRSGTLNPAADVEESTLIDRLEALNNMKTYKKGLAVLENIQTTLVHFMYVLDGTTAPIKPNSPVFIPNLPHTLDSFVEETERIMGSKLDAQKRTYVESLVKGSSPNLKVQLLAAALVSPILLFQSFRLEKKTWRKKEILDTMSAFGNEKPALLLEVEAEFWRMLMNLRDSGTPLLRGLLVMFERLPWDRLEAAPSEVSGWFSCKSSNTEVNWADEEDAKYEEDEDHSHDDDDEGEDEEGETDHRADAQSSVNNGGTPAIPPTLPIPRTSNDGYTAPMPPSSPITARSRTPVLENVPSPSPISSQFGGGGTSMSIERGFVMCSALGAVNTPSQDPLSSDSNAQQGNTDGAACGHKRPREEYSLDEQVKRQRGANLDPRTSTTDDVHSDAFATVDSTTTSSSAKDTTETDEMSPGAESPMSAFAADEELNHQLGDTVDEPICLDMDVEEIYSHRFRTPAPSRAIQPHTLYLPKKVLQTAFDQQIPVSGIDGSRLDFCVVFVHEQERDLLFKAAQNAFAAWMDNAPHAADMYETGNRSVFLDWMRWFNDGRAAYNQDTQRWRVLLFDRRRAPEPEIDYLDFGSTVRQRVVRYGNDVVIHDHSAAEDPHDQRRAFAGPASIVVDEASISREDRSTIYSIPPVASFRSDSFDSLYCSETYTYEATHHRTEQFRGSASPAQTLSYRSALLQGGMEHWQFSPSGLGVAITIECGELYVVVADPGDAAMFDATVLDYQPGDALPTTSKFESVLLLRGHRIVIPPCTFYLVYAVKDSVLHKRYFYNPVHMQLTQTALVHSLVLGSIVAREPVDLEVALPILCRMMVCWHDVYLGENEGSRSFCPTFSPPLPEDTQSWHVPTLSDFNSVVDLFSLINTILLMPAYDRRMYPSDGGATNAWPGAVSELSRGDWMLYQLARQLALKVGDWFFSKHQLLASERTRFLGGKDEFWAVSLLHSANMLVRYHALAERKQIPTLLTTEQVQKQLRYCLQPLEKEIRSRTNLPTCSPKDMALFLDPEQLEKISDQDNEIPTLLSFLLFRTTPDMDLSTLPSPHRRPE